MKCQLLVFVLAVFCQWGWAMEATEICRKSFPSVVVVNARDADGNELAYGSGFSVGERLIATNVHVVAGAVAATVRVINSKDSIRVEGVVGIDYENDVAILQIAKGLDAKLELDGSNAHQIGEDVYAIGNPRGLEGTFSKGMLSASREVNGMKILQITAPISPGSSGGPILSADGKVIGMAVSYVADGQNLNFAVPSSVIVKAIDGITKKIDLGLVKQVEKKVKPNALEGNVVVQVGFVKIQIGEDREAVIAKLREYYKVQYLKQDSILVSERKGDVWKIIGTVYMERERVALVSVNVIETSDPGAVALVKAVYSRISEIAKSGRSVAILDSSVAHIDIPESNVRLYTIAIKFPGYELQLTAQDPISGSFYYVSVEESFK